MKRFNRPLVQTVKILYILFNLVDSLGVCVPISNNLRYLKPKTLNFLGEITNRSPKPNGNSG